MKMFFGILAAFLNLTAYSQAANLPSIECSSINRFSVRSEDRPLPLDRMVKLNLNPTDQSQDYALTFTWINLSTNQTIGKPVTRNVRADFIKNKNLYDIHIHLGSMGDDGIFTSLNVPNLLSSSEPFVMYGWSRSPLTVTSAMEYRCEVVGIN